MADIKSPKISSSEDACEIIELAAREIDTLASAFNLIADLCSESASGGSDAITDELLLH